MSLWKFKPGIAAVLHVTDVAGAQEHCLMYMGPAKIIVYKGGTEYPLGGFPLPPHVKSHINDHFYEVFKKPAEKRTSYLNLIGEWEVEVSS